MSQLAAGDLSVQVPVRGDDEVAQLAAAFNSMANEIRGNTERLEGEVARRTTELEMANREITELSITDALTGCHNRHYLNQQLPREIDRAGRYGRRLSVVMCDLDHFKSVNDTHGHAAGDAVLGPSDATSTPIAGRPTGYAGSVARSSSSCCPRPDWKRPLGSLSACAWVLTGVPWSTQMARLSL